MQNKYKEFFVCPLFLPVFVSFPHSQIPCLFAMLLADGEYEIDVSALTELRDSDSFAIRYGFIPDSMDQLKPLKLYQTDKECLIQAQPTTPGRPIIFEGQAMRHRRAQNPALDQYYLLFGELSEVHLRRLNSTVRVSKTRNASKWEDQIVQWEKLPQNEPVEVPRVVPKESYRPQKVASKRPPTATPEIRDDDIIGESDFDDLAGSESEFPVIVVDDIPRQQVQSEPKRDEPKKAEESNRKVQQHEVTEDIHKKADEPKKMLEQLKMSTDQPKMAPARLKTRPALAPLRRPTALPKRPTALPKRPKRDRKVAPTEEASLDDDFKDLEDQLQEVLNEEKSDSEEEYGRRVPIVINYDDDNHSSNKYNFNERSNIKPTSLRDFYGSKNDDVSSSEEE